MDHLKSPDERRARWYSNVTPRSVPVTPASRWEDLLTTNVENTSCALSVPFSWLAHTDNHSSCPEDFLMRCILRNGFAVISGVLKADECRRFLPLAWDWVEAASYAEEKVQDLNGSSIATSSHASLCQHESSSSLPDLNCFPVSLEGGILPFYGSGHSKFAWEIRSNPNVRHVFSALHHTDQLVSSLDGIVLWHVDQKLDSGWFHIDQNPQTKPHACSVQGIVNLLPVSSYTGGNVLVLGSHSQFPEHYLQHPDRSCREFYQTRLSEVHGDDWMEIDPNDCSLLTPSRVVSLELQEGDVLLWDSRTVHCSHPPSETNQPPSKEPKQGSSSLIRAATLVTMIPAMSVPESVLMDRKELVNEMRTLTHWANQVTMLGAECDEQSRLEKKRVALVREWQQKNNRLVLCTWDDLSEAQQSLVMGTSQYPVEETIDLGTCNIVDRT